ncbi:trigger factor [Pararhizobium mangrovi]|uniref:Trigger factor n=1 Tax=Pararhizobium mangrovi TaxID=2590452 RepID=A0A506U7T0_9HYPH|nr:trigger factor [Pararhizobium mangrovi]
MQVTETLSEGLKREIKVVIPASDMEARRNERLAETKDRVRINGFRPGKVPMSHLKKMYGKSIMAELVNELVRDKPNEILSERGEKAATQPEVNMTEDESEANEILDANKDFEFSLAYEVIPPIELKDMSEVKVTRQVVEIPQEEVDEQIRRIADNTRAFETKEGAAEKGDRVTMDFVGKIDSEPFEGGSAENHELVLGSGTFIPGFEDQLEGVKAGDEKRVTVTFPEDYGEASLAGKEAVFDVTVKDVASAPEAEIDDELATKLGVESLDKLRELVRGQIESQYGQMTRQKVKRQILDQLDEMYRFDVPETLVEAEFQNIWRQVNTDLEQAGKTFEDEETTEEEARAEYRKLAERRVRLGLVLSEVGEKAGVEVSEQEMQQALQQQLQQFPGQEQQIYQYFQQNPGAIASLRAPIFEEKTVDHLLGEIDVTDETVSKEELMAEEDDDERASTAAG